MKPASRFGSADRRKSVVSRFLFNAVGALTLGLLITGCVTRPGRGPAMTQMDTQPVQVPATILANFFLVESPQADGTTRRFMVDTGSSVTLVSPNLSTALKLKEDRHAPPRTLAVRGANGREVELPAIALRELWLGKVLFRNVPAVVFDFSELSAHLGVSIDGIIGFPVFKDTLFTLDYPGAMLVIAPNPVVASPITRQPKTSVIAYNREKETPRIPVQMDNESFFVLIDSGSDLGLSLNPAGLHPRFAHGPRVGMILSSIDGDKRQLVGRLDQNIVIGTQLVQQPVVDLTEHLSSLGGEMLQHFRLTFDQQRHLVTLVRNPDGPVLMEGRRSTGLSFRRFPNYWRLLAVVPDTPNSDLPVQPGDLCVRINGELVEKWTLERYNELVKSANHVTYTFLSGAKETDYEVKVFELVP